LPGQSAPPRTASKAGQKNAPASPTISSAAGFAPARQVAGTACVGNLSRSRQPVVALFHQSRLPLLRKLAGRGGGVRGDLVGIFEDELVVPHGNAERAAPGQPPEQQLLRQRFLDILLDDPRERPRAI